MKTIKWFSKPACHHLSFIMQKHISYSKNNKYQYLINHERNIINYDMADNKKNFVIPAKDWKHEVYQD